MNSVVKKMLVRFDIAQRKLQLKKIILEFYFFLFKNLRIVVSKSATTKTSSKTSIPAGIANANMNVVLSLIHRSRKKNERMQFFNAR